MPPELRSGQPDAWAAAEARANEAEARLQTAQKQLETVQSAADAAQSALQEEIHALMACPPQTLLPNSHWAAPPGSTLAQMSARLM
jgi:Tfp pilus assembly protein FimV